MTIRAIPKKTLVYAAAALLLALIFVLQETVHPRRNTIPLPALPDDIDRITFEDDGRSLSLYRDNGEEWVVGDERYPGDGELVVGFIETVRGIDDADVISSRGNYEDYGFGEGEESAVRFFSGSEEPLSILFGEAAAAGSHVYGRLNRSREVVMLPLSIRDTLSTDAATFRERVMASIAEEDVVRIEVDAPDHGIVTIQRARPGDSDEAVEEDEAVWEADIEGDIAPGRFQNLFQELASLEAQDFPEGEREGQPFATLRVDTATDGPVEIALWAPDEARSFPVRVSTSDYDFFIPEWRARRLLLGLERYFAPFDEESTPGA